MIRVLITEDEPAIREMVRFTLERAGLECVEAADAAQARAALASGGIDLLLLDWMLPGESGIDLLAALRRAPATQRLPVIMLTARTGSADKVDALEAGADDHIDKPFSPSELVARIRALLRRTGSAAGSVSSALTVGGLTLDPDGHRAAASGEPLALNPTEFRLLQFLMTHPDRAWTRRQLLDRVWGEQAFVEERTVDVQIRRLRKALAPSGHDGLIQTVHGHGYRFSERP